MNKYSMYSRKKEVQEGEIILVGGIEYLQAEDVKPNVHRNRPFLILRKLENERYLGLKISGSEKDLVAQYRISLSDVPKNNIITKNSYLSCDAIYEIDNSNILQNGFLIKKIEYTKILNYTMKLYALGYEVGSPERVQQIYEYYMLRKRITLGSVIKVPYNEDYLFIYDETDTEYICLPLHKEVQEDTQDTVKVLKGVSYVNYDEKFMVPKNDIIYIHWYGDPSNPLINQIKHPEEALELSLYYFKK